MKMMRIRSLILALAIGAGLFLPVQTLAQAKTHYKTHYKTGRKAKKFKRAKVKSHRGRPKPRRIHHS